MISYNQEQGNHMLDLSGGYIMFDDSGFGGGSMFDSNHDGYLNAFERNHAECFLHDCDTYDQVMKKENFSSNRGRRASGSGDTIATLIILFIIIFVVCLLDAIICSIGRY